MSGNITVYTGPMYSCKSAMMFFAYDKTVISGKKVAVVKPKLDDRFGEDAIKSRGLELSLKAANITDISELLKFDADVFIIDEFQFLAGDVLIIQKLANQGKIFYISGLDMTAEGKPFGPMPELLAIADKVYKQVAICADCRNENAVFSFYLGQKNRDILVGNSEYIPLCRTCWQKRMEKKEKGIVCID